MTDDLRPLAFPELPPASRKLMEAPYPRFSAAELARRRQAIAQEMAQAGIDHLVIYGAGYAANRLGGIVHWLTQWPVTTEALGIVTPGQPDKLYIQHYNHVPQARRLAEAQVEWGGRSSAASGIEELTRRGAKPDRVGFIGGIDYRFHQTLTERFGRLTDLNPVYTKLRLVKSAEELDWFRLAAALTDRGMAALAAGIRPGLTERELGAIIEAGYAPYGATTGIHFLGVTPMAEPTLHVPAQHPSSRRVAVGDIVFSEITANFFEHSGQVLRSFSVGCEPTPLYRDLHATAEAAFDAMTAVLRPGATPADLVTASGVIEAAGFTTCDDIVHGYGGGYLTPVIGSKSRPAGPIPDLTFVPGMMIVVQPNVITKDGKAGVQTGECVLVTETGWESLHHIPRGFRRVG